MDDNLKQALAEFVAPQPHTIEFRLYYDKETGMPLCYSMDTIDGEYINITSEDFALARYDIRVQDGKIVPLPKVSIGKLVPSESGFGTTINDITIVGNDIFWRVKTYDGTGNG